MAEKVEKQYKGTERCQHCKAALGNHNSTLAAKDWPYTWITQGGMCRRCPIRLSIYRYPHHPLVDPLLDALEAEQSDTKEVESYAY